ncbi:hypothetical protein CF115_07865 [Aeromonas veronii]|nr:hypothetical protein CF115_07865 [Aeromonas veronii]
MRLLVSLTTYWLLLVLRHYQLSLFCRKQKSQVMVFGAVRLMFHIDQRKTLSALLSGASSLRQ